MNNIRVLLSLELRSMFGINRMLHTKDPKERGRYRLLCVAWILLIAMAISYVSGLVFGLCTLGMSAIVPAYLAVLASVCIVMFGIFTAGNKIFSQKGYDLLVSMPLSSRAIVLSRFLGMYLADLALTGLIMIPGIVTYGICVQPSFWFYLLAMIGMLFVPAIPLVLSTLIGTLVLAISSRMKGKNMVQTVLMVLLVVGVMVVSFGMGNMTEEIAPDQLSNLVQTVSGVIQKIYPPAIWLSDGVVHPNVWMLGLFVLVSAAVAALTVFVVSVRFSSILHRLMSFHAKHDYKIRDMTSRGLLKTLYLREAKRYFSSSIYVTNTIIGPILGAVMAIALCVAGVESVQGAIPLPVNIPSLLPFVFAAIFCMMTTTSVSISMEGKHIWIVKSLPIPVKTWLDSKILFNLSLMFPFYLVSVAALAIGTRASLLETVWLVLVPLSLMLFAAVFGITINLKLHRFDWEQEAAVVKQSAPAMLGGFSGFFASLLSGMLVLLVPTPLGDWAKLAVCLLLLIATALMYRSNNRKNFADL